MKKSIKITCYILSSLILLIPITFVILEWQIEYRYSLPYKESNLVNIEYHIEEPSNTTKESLTKEINALFDNPNYELYFDALPFNIYGKTDIFNKRVTIRTNISNIYYVFCLSHELVHLTYFTLSERFCNLTAYNILYNSNNEYFVNIALYFANVDLHGGFSEEYSFVGYLQEGNND